MELKLAVVSLGCAKNLVDTEIMLGQLHNEGWEITDDFAAAELILINTCGFITSAKTESINNILELAEYKKPGCGVCRKLVVAGCLVQRYAAELAAQIPEVDYWVGQGEISQLNQILKEPSLKHDVLLNQEPFLNDEGLPRLQVTLSHTTYVKIAEGCNHHCSYCAIPGIKGKFRSRQPQAIVAEVAKLVAAGVKEINIIAQDITMYGRDLEPQSSLTDLLKQVIKVAKPLWLRLLYAYPAGLETDLLDLIAAQPSICKYLDLPIQHINDRLLRLMNRHDPADLIKAKLAAIRDKVPGIVLRTTLIAGFPGETEAEFNEALSFVKAGYFEHLGVFSYSREENTPAYSLKPQLSEELKLKRLSKLFTAQQANVTRFLKAQVGMEQKVLIDRVLADGNAVGRTQSFAPESDGVVIVANFQGIDGEFVPVLITGHDGYNLLAKEISRTDRNFADDGEC